MTKGFFSVAHLPIKTKLFSFYQFFISSTVQRNHGGTEKRKFPTEQINAGTPLIGSAPHFYNGANQFVYGVIGLDPEKEKHETFFILEAVRINYKRSSLM